MENAGIQSDSVRVAMLGDHLGEKAEQTESPDISELTERALKKLKEKRKGAKVFCVSCGAQKRTLRKWRNSYLCTDCYKIMENAGEEQFLKSVFGIETKKSSPGPRKPKDDDISTYQEFSHLRVPFDGEMGTY